MKTLYFSLLFALCIALIRADGQSYQATWYGGKDDDYRDRYPSCLDSEWPDTDYYAAVDTDYGKKLCNTYAVVMGVDDDGKHLGSMVKVRIIDSCHECEPSHIDLSQKAFNSIRKEGDGRFNVIWVAANSKGEVTRDVIYPSSATEKFAKNSFGLSKSQFVSMYKKQALKMIVNGETHGTFDKYAVPTTTTRKTTTTTTTTTTRKTTTTTTRETTRTTTRNTTTTTVAPTVIPTTAPIATKIQTTPIVTPALGTTVAPIGTATTILQSATTIAPPTTVAGLGDINIITGETKDQTVPEDAPIVGQTKTVDPNQTVYDDEDIKTLESQFPDKEGEGGSYTVGVLSAALTVSGAAGIGLLYLKKQSPGRYDEIKQKFPEAFDNIKRGVSRRATSIRRGVTRTATSIKGKGGAKVSRHGEHSGINYREMPDHMFGSDGLPRIELHDEPMSSFPETTIRM